MCVHWRGRLGRAGLGRNKTRSMPSSDRDRVSLQAVPVAEVPAPITEPKKQRGRAAKAQDSTAKPKTEHKPPKSSKPQGENQPLLFRNT